MKISGRIHLEVPGGQCIDPAAVEMALERFKVNPVLRHAFNGPPVGRVTSAKVDGGGILIEAEVLDPRYTRFLLDRCTCQPGYIVRREHTADGLRVIDQIDLMEISLVPRSPEGPGLVSNITQEARTMNAERKMLKLTQLSPMPGNRLGGMDDAAIAELAASIRVRGVLQDLLVRPGKADRFEIVCGVRRAKAAERVGLTEVPCLVQVLDDVQAVGARAAENLNRVNLHPLEEAECYRDLVKRSGTVGAVARSLGKSASHVRSRLQLLALSPKARTAFAGGKVSLTVMLHLARIEDHGVQDRILGEALRRDTTEAAAAGETVDDAIKAMPDLTDAPFDTADKSLPGPDGKPLACAACPMASRNQVELFADLSPKAAVCMKPKCCTLKSLEAAKRTVAKLHTAGATVLPLDQGRRLFSSRDYDLEHGRAPLQSGEGGKYVDLEGKMSGVKGARWDDERPIAKVLEGLPAWRKMPAAEREKLIVHALDPLRRVRRLLPATFAAGLLAKGGQLTRRTGASGDAAERKRQEAESKARRAFRAGYWLVAEAVAKAANAGGIERALQLAVRLLAGGDPRNRRWGADPGGDVATPVRTGLYLAPKDKRPADAKLAALLIVDHLFPGPGAYDSKWPTEALRVFSAYKLDAAAIQTKAAKAAELQRAVDRKAKAAATRAAKAKTKGKRA